MKTPLFLGCGVALVTPFRDGEIDLPAFQLLIRRQLDAGTDALIVCATTGEAPTLRERERTALIRSAVEEAAQQVPVIVGTGSNDTAHAVELSRAAESLGADGVLVVTPYYNKSTQSGLIAHYLAIADAVHIPVIVYNVPSRTGSNISPQSMAKLVRETKNVGGIKDATGDLAQCAMTMHLCGDALEVFAGNDDVIVPVMALGGKGVISVLSNIAPKQTHDICVKCLEGDFKTAGKMQAEAMPLIKALFCEVNPIPVKYGLELLGFSSMSLRLPLTEMSAANRPLLEQEMKAYGLLK